MRHYARRIPPEFPVNSQQGAKQRCQTQPQGHFPVADLSYQCVLSFISKSRGKRLCVPAFRPAAQRTLCRGAETVENRPANATASWVFRGLAGNNGLVLGCVLRLSLAFGGSHSSEEHTSELQSLLRNSSAGF